MAVAPFTGTGRTTILKWTGQGALYDQGGWAHAWFEGITWDGQNSAAVGIENRIAKSETPPPEAGIRTKPS